MQEVGRALRVVVPDGRLGRRGRLALTLEILLSYIELLPLLRRNDLPGMVAGARRTRVAPTAVPPGIDERYLAARIGRAVHRVIDVLPTDKRCLINSLVTVRVLAHRSVDSRVVIGVQGGGGFAAHAWVEYDGIPILPPGEFQRLIEL